MGHLKMTDVMKTLEDKQAEYKSKGVTRVKLGLTDIDGVIRGKYISVDKFFSILETNGGFCDCVFGWDVNDELYSEPGYTGWQSGFPDTGYRLLVETEIWIANENCPYFIGEFVTSEGSDHPLCPRTKLYSVLKRFAESGLRVKSGFEYEFFVFSETPHSIRQKNYTDLTPLTPGNFGYSVLRSSAESDLFLGLLDHAAELGCELEGLHCETGPGVWEAALKPSAGIIAADRAALFKTFSKVFFQKRELLATFMAKWSMDYPGQSGHYHFSLIDGETDQNVFFDPSAKNGMSEKQTHVVGGLVKYLPEFLALIAPTINSYTRLVKGAWAPTASTWGLENRTSSIRVIPGSEKSQRIECRVGGADGNSYLVAAAVLGAALLGIEEEIDPGEPVVGNAYEVEDDLPADRKFPTNLRESAARFDQSLSARRVFGDDFVDHFVLSRRHEASEYERSINDWQLERYFEII